jgi:hypothetical protein
MSTVCTAVAVLPLDGFPSPTVAVQRPALEPVELDVLRRCHFKRKPTHPRTGARQLGCATCGLPKLHADHMGQPPSVNVFGSGDRMAFYTVKKAWQELLTGLLEASALPKGLSYVLVEGEVTFPRRASSRGPDQGNFRGPLEKILGDVLEAGGWLASDNWESYEFGGLAYRYERGVSRTRLLIFPRG